MSIVRESILAACLICLGVLLRILCVDIPNVAPVAAFAIFAGYLFRSKSLAVTVPLGIMIVSDFFVGGYDFWMMIAVYVGLSVPVLLGIVLRRMDIKPSKGSSGDSAVGSTGRARSATSVFAAMLGSAMFALIGSFFFYSVTNLACWYYWYDPTASELMTCYVSALPFLRQTIIGDQFFTFSIFGIYFAASQIAFAIQNHHHKIGLAASELRSEIQADQIHSNDS